MRYFSYQIKHFTQKILVNKNFRFKMNYLLGKNKSSVENDELVDKNLIKHWQSLIKQPNIIGNTLLFQDEY